MQETSTRSFFGARRQQLGYFGLLISVALLYFWIRAYGDTLSAPPQPGSTGVGGSLSQVHVNDFLHVLLALALVIACARTLGALFRYIHQPPVVGEMIAGIMLGPSLLGHLAPSFAAYLLPQSIAPLLNVISQMGVILYMFLVGLEVDVSSLRAQAHSTITISHASIVVPFLLGALLSLLLYPNLSNSSVSFTAFSLFLGVSMSVTAFPVLARILTDRGIHKTKMGSLALAAAAIDDVTAWCLLAFVVSVTQSRPGHALPTILLAIGYIAFMLLLVRPFVVRLTGWIDTKGGLTQSVLAIILLSILLSSLATETIGIHSIFGAFVLGAIIPHGSALARDMTSKLEDFVVVFLLPAFFAFTGLRTQIGLVSGKRQWIFCLVIVAIASIGKFGGSAIAARLSGLSWRDSSAIGVLMNTRGLMELIVLNIGLELHVISPTLFAMLVLMALATTFATTPILHFITPRGRWGAVARGSDQAPPPERVVNDRIGTLIPISKANSIGMLIDLATSLTPPNAPPPRVLALSDARSGATVSRVREVEHFSPSRSPMLAAALDAAWARGTVITPEAAWTADPATDIVEAADRGRVRWVLLESHRSLFRRNPDRGTVSRVMEKMVGLPVNVAVLVPSLAGSNNRIICFVEDAGDGIAAVELAAHVNRHNHDQVQVVLLSANSQDVEDDVTSSPSWLSEVAPDWPVMRLSVASSQGLIKALPAGLWILAKDFVERWKTLLDGLSLERGVIVVQGGRNADSPSASQDLKFDALPASS